MLRSHGLVSGFFILSLVACSGGDDAPDTGMPAPDTGMMPMPDAGMPMPDTGMMPMPDAGMPMPDAGMPDMGMPDTGPPPEAYTKEDQYVPKVLAKWLRPHQREGVKFMYECVMGMRDFDGNGCILADGRWRPYSSIACVSCMLLSCHLTSLTMSLWSCSESDAHLTLLFYFRRKKISLPNNTHKHLIHTNT